MGTIPTEAEAYEAFVNTCMQQLHAGLELDHTEKKQRVAGTLQTHVLNKKKSAAQRVLEGRFILGADDAAYLQTGLATLWSTAPTDTSNDGLDKGLALSPPGLYTPDAVGGIRAGLVRALKAKAKTLERNAPADLAALVPALSLLLETPVIRNAVIGGDIDQGALKKLLKYKWANMAKDDQQREQMRADLLKVLRKLKTYLESAKRDKGGAKTVATLIVKAVEKQASQLAKVRGELSTTNGQLKQREEEVARQKKTIVSLKLELGGVRTTLKTTKTEHAKATTRVVTLEATIKVAKTMETNLRRFLHASQQGRKLLRAEKNALNAQVQEFRSELKIALDALAECDEELVAARASIVRLIGERDGFKTSSETRTAELAEMGTEITEKQDRIVQLENRVNVLTATKNLLSTKLQTAEDRTKELTVENEEQEMKLEAQQVVLGDTAKGAREAQLEAEALGKQLADAKAKVDDLERDKDGLTTALAASGSRVSRLEQELDVMKTSMEQLEADMVKNNEAKRRISDQLLTANVNRSMLDLELVKAIERTAQWEASAVQLRKDLADCEIESAKLKASLDDCETESAKLQAKVQKMKNMKNLQAAMKSRRQAKKLQNEEDAGDKEPEWLQKAEVDAFGSPSERLNSEVAALAKKSGSKEEFERSWREILTDAGVAMAFLTGMVAWGVTIYSTVANNEPSPPIPDYVPIDTLEAIRKWMESFFGTNAAIDPMPVVNGIDFSNWVVARGLVGQRGPACAAVTHETDATIAAVDARLEYALPSPQALGAVLPHLKLLLDGTDEPTEAEVRAALATDDDDACGGTATAAETMAAFKGNYAVLGEPVDAKDDRGGIEVPHAVRWLPATGAAGRSAARVAMLEHVMARCAQLAESDATSTPVKAALREAAATLKLTQMAPLYATREAVAYDEPERSGCWHAPSSASAEHGILVTRPCAIVRGALAFPVDAGIARVACDRRATSVMGDAAEANAANAKYHEATLRVRAQARSEGRATNVYVAPPARELRFASAGTTAATGAALLSDDLEVTEDVTPADFTAGNWLRIVNRALVATSALLPENDAAVERVEGLLAAVSEEGVTAEQRRDGLWTEFRRHSAISQDRLWVFLRLLSGSVGGEVNEIITMADEATLRATKAIQDQRVAIAKRVSDMQAKIVETVVGSMAKDSKLTLDKNGNQLVVIDSEARKQMKDLANGESGRPFFEANVAVRNLQSNDASAPKPTLAQLLSSLSQVGGQMQRSLEQTLTSTGTASASLTELSHPANCYFVTMRADAIAAIRIAHERMNTELGLRGAGRRLSLWEVIEGGSTMLTTRFAEFTGHVLVQARSTTGVSAMYVGVQAMNTNAMQARVALERLVHVGGAYTYAVREPSWLTLKDQDADVSKARAAIMNAGSEVEDHAVGMMMRRTIHGTPTRPLLSTHQHSSGWAMVGMATR